MIAKNKLSKAALLYGKTNLPQFYDIRMGGSGLEELTTGALADEDMAKR